MVLPLVSGRRAVVVGFVVVVVVVVFGGDVALAGPLSLLSPI